MAKQKPERSFFADVIKSHQEASHPDPQSPKSLDTEPPKGLAKSANAKYIKLTAYVPRELHRAAKARLVEQDREISDLIENLVSDWLQRQSPAK